MRQASQSFLEVLFLSYSLSSFLSGFPQHERYSHRLLPSLSHLTDKMKRFTSIRKEKRKSANMALSPTEATVPERQETLTSIASDEAVPDTDPNTVRVCSIAW